MFCKQQQKEHHYNTFLCLGLGWLKCKSNLLHIKLKSTKTNKGKVRNKSFS